MFFTEERQLAMWAAGFGSIYLVMCFVAGLVVKRNLAWELAIASTGCACLAPLVKSYELRGWIEPFRVPVARTLFVISLADGILAGVFLI